MLGPRARSEKISSRKELGDRILVRVYADHIRAKSNKLLYTIFFIELVNMGVKSGWQIWRGKKDIIRGYRWGEHNPWMYRQP